MWAPRFMRSTRLLLILCVIGFHNCSSSSKILMKPANVIERDVFTCKGLSDDQRWVGITDEFLPEEDSRVVVVASLADVDLRNIVHFELINPFENIVSSEKIMYPRENPLAIYYSLPALMKSGGKGEWKSLVFVDGEAIGQAKFHVGEKPKEEEEEGSNYFIIGEESLNQGEPSLEDLGDGFSSYIREVTPNLTIPLSENPMPSLDTVGSVTP